MRREHRDSRGRFFWRGLVGVALALLASGCASQAPPPPATPTRPAQALALATPAAPPPPPAPLPTPTVAGPQATPTRSAAVSTAPQTPLASVKSWLYLISVNLKPETVAQIRDSRHDLVVLDFIPSERSNTRYPMADVIAQLHNAPHPKLVLAYIDIGQAEEYRTYWQPGWGIGNPDWIAGDDPDEWEGNFPVAYWREEWRNIWLGPNGYLQAIVDAGFDGVYLDWVEAYSDDNVRTVARRDGVNPRREMVRWVGDIAQFGRARRPDFLVVAQNAAELVELDEYVAIIDALAQEQTWFDGAADDDPPGDCPLPRTSAEKNSTAYRQSLSPGCLKMYDNRQSTLHMSSEEYLYHLTMARDKGKPVFTVDYALKPENVASVYQMSRSLGFIPFVSNRHLDRFVAPVP